MAGVATHLRFKHFEDIGLPLIAGHIIAVQKGHLLARNVGGEMKHRRSHMIRVLDADIAAPSSFTCLQMSTMGQSILWTKGTSLAGAQRVRHPLDQI